MWVDHTIISPGENPCKSFLPLLGLDVPLTGAIVTEDEVGILGAVGLPPASPSPSLLVSTQESSSARQGLLRIKHTFGQHAQTRLFRVLNSIGCEICKHG